MKIYYITFLIFAVGLLVILSITESQPTTDTPAQQLEDYQVQDMEIAVKLHIVESDGKESMRNEEEAGELTGEANRIWRQAGIRFSVTSVSHTDIEGRTISDAVNGSPAAIALVEGYGPDRINVFFVPELDGINGISFPSYRSILIADYTTVHDYRTLAHELGHILGLRHSPYEEKLMATGTNGELLGLEEISFARYKAGRVFH